ncbi:hypothetical protein IWX90DRAFT_422674 [Phyllosticta citrichinensis]|uniref:Uncharacterized protein n=1 Tax=Phyllosticta citrichinensis TaxID=1130410 RepID=A0ABR1Y8Y8_9PEZI
MWRWNPYPRKSQTGEAFAQRRQGDGEGGGQGNSQPAKVSCTMRASATRLERIELDRTTDRQARFRLTITALLARIRAHGPKQGRRDRSTRRRRPAGARRRRDPPQGVLCSVTCSPLNHQPRRLKREDWPRLPSGCEWRSPPMRLKAHQPYRQTQPPHPNFLRAHLRCVRLAPILVIWVAWLMVPVTQ